MSASGENETLNIWSKGHTKKNVKHMLEDYMNDADENEGLMVDAKATGCSSKRCFWGTCVTFVILAVTLALVFTVGGVGNQLRASQNMAKDDDNFDDRINNGSFETNANVDFVDSIVDDDTPFRIPSNMAGNFDDDDEFDVGSDSKDGEILSSVTGSNQDFVQDFDDDLDDDDFDDDDFDDDNDDDDFDDDDFDDDETVPGCQDDPDFRIAGHADHGCEWANIKLVYQRCAHEGMVENCPATCDPACRVDPYDDDDQESAQYIEELVEEKGATPAFVEDTANYCVDDPLFRYKNQDFKGCSWVAAKLTRKRCSHPGVTEACRLTCDPICQLESASAEEGEPTPTPTYLTYDPTSDPTSDETGAPTEGPTWSCENNPDFRKDGIEYEDCNWAAEKLTVKRCAHEGVAENCPGVCYPECQDDAARTNTAKVRSKKPVDDWDQF